MNIWQEPTNYLSVSHYFVQLVLKGFKIFIKQAQNPIHFLKGYVQALISDTFFQ